MIRKNNKKMKIRVSGKRKISTVYEYFGIKQIRKKIGPPEQKFGGSVKEKNRRERKKIREQLKKKEGV